MSNPSPSRGSRAAPSPERHKFAIFTEENRNDELSHQDALAAAQAEHDRVREAAVRVYYMYELELQQKRILEEERKEEERLAAEARVVEEEKKLRELRAKQVPKLPPEPKPEPPKEPPAPKPAPAPTPATSTTAPPPNGDAAELNKWLAQNPEKAQELLNLYASKSQAAPTELPPKPNVTDSPQPNPFGAKKDTPPQSQPAQKPNGVLQPSPAAQVVPKPPAAGPTNRQAALVQRYSQIHQQLKKLRADLQKEAKPAGHPLKQMGVFRREIRTAIGQLTGGRGANAAPVS
jgi:nucleoporin GLE1